MFGETKKISLHSQPKRASVRSNLFVLGAVQWEEPRCVASRRRRLDASREQSIDLEPRITYIFMNKIDESSETNDTYISTSLYLMVHQKQFSTMLNAYLF